jgi:hypothetical protein
MSDDLIKYALNVMAALLAAPADATTYYFGCLAGLAPSTTAALARLYIPKSGKLSKANISWYASGVAGSNESISVYIRVNNATDYLIASKGDTNAFKLFSNNRMTVNVMIGDYVEIKIVCPTWATNPTNLVLGGSLILE